jgi:predicted SnoaL-like aldol condensation-catalyzing enzyme
MKSLPATSSEMDERLERNKAAVVAFYDASYNHKDFDRAAQHLGPYLVQHDPVIADGLDGFRVRIDWFRANYPKLRVEIKRIFADGDYVITHVHGVREPGHPGSAIVEIFRLEAGKIVEHWDVLQPIPDEARNENGML